MNAPAAALTRSARGRRSGAGRMIARYAFVLPPLLYLLVFIFWPLARQLWMSFTDAKLANPTAGRFVGLRNYSELIADPALYGALKVTVLYATGSVLFGLAVGVIAALAINEPFRGRPVARAILLFGWAVPNVAAALIWLWMFNDRSGVFNNILMALGFGRMRWLTSVQLALPSLFAVTVWNVAPFVMLVVLAALQTVPEEQREAARIDGADRLNVFRTVTLPHILPAIQLSALLVAVWSIRRFELIYLLTGGGPLGGTSTLVVKLRQVAFEDYELGMAGVYGVIGLALALLVAAAYYAIEQRRLRWLAQ